jgi:hypothetical protein
VTGTTASVVGVCASTPAGCADSMAIARTVQTANVDQRDMCCPRPLTWRGDSRRTERPIIEGPQ